MAILSKTVNSYLWYHSFQMKKPPQKTDLATLLTFISVFLMTAGIITGTYLTQKENIDTRSQASMRPLASYSCPTSSNQTYESIRPDTPAHRKISNPENNPEVNIDLRGWGEVNEAKEPVNYGGDTDPNPPPSFGSVFSGRYPQIVKTYIIYEWDWANNKPNVGKSATPAWPVHLMGFGASPGEPLLGLKAGRSIWGDFSLMVLYASENSITFTHSTGDTAPPNDDGYPIYFVDICVDPNLLAKYREDNAGGRQGLPAIRPGQIFGYAKDTDVKAAVRDTGSFMDPRSRKDWWQFGPPDGPIYQPINLPTPTSLMLPATPTIIPTAPFIPSPTNIVLSPTLIPTIPPTIAPPTQTIIYVLPSPTSVPTPTITLTPTPAKSLTQIIVENPIFNLMRALKDKISLFLKVSLP